MSELTWEGNIKSIPWKQKLLMFLRPMLSGQILYLELFQPPGTKYEIRNTKYAKLTNSRKLDEERINQKWALSWSLVDVSINGNRWTWIFCRHMIWLRKILKNSNYLNPSSSSLKFDKSFESGTFGFVKSQNLIWETFAERVGLWMEKVDIVTLQS